MVIDTVNMYFSTYTYRFTQGFPRRISISEKIAKTKHVTPIQIFDCCVKYKSRRPQWEYPSLCAKIMESNTPANVARAIAKFIPTDTFFFTVTIYYSRSLIPIKVLLLSKRRQGAQAFAEITFLHALYPLRPPFPIPVSPFPCPF